ncbi:hypothetical protein Tco_0594177 [Tanacetum coccineum]
MITPVYYVEGLGHNLFSIGQFCDADLEVAFRRNLCFVRNIEGVNLLSGTCGTIIYTINIHDMTSSSPIRLMITNYLNPFLVMTSESSSHLNPLPLASSAKDNLSTGSVKV